VLGTNLEGEEAAKATKVVAAQAAALVDTRAGGVAAIEVPDRRAIRINHRATLATKLKSLGQAYCVTSMIKGDISSKTASGI
jgi:hypothetical protein